jgi:hypothetical protein
LEITFIKNLKETNILTFRLFVLFLYVSPYGGRFEACEATVEAGVLGNLQMIFVDVISEKKVSKKKV